jgi:tetratricopeptide (TPR) repeat protein
LTGSSAFTLVQPAEIVSALRLMKREPGTRIDSAVARDIAQRTGMKAIVDGDVTGVPGGYIVSIRLVRADSGGELASFRETGDGPRGLIDAADKLARALRGKVGESLRSVNATPPLAVATTASLEALKNFSEGVRWNRLGDDRAIALARVAVGIDSTFASAWSLLGAALSNYGGTRSSIDSAIAQAYRYRERLPELERDMVVARYFGLGPGRDRGKSIAAYESILQRDSNPTVMVNLGEQLRSRREFARAEALNLAAAKLQPAAGTSFGNALELQLDQGKLKDAVETIAGLKERAPDYALVRQFDLSYAQGDDKSLRSAVDSALGAGEQLRKRVGVPHAISLALKDGRLRDFASLGKEAERSPGPGPNAPIQQLALSIAVSGPSPANLAALDTAIARVPFRDLPMVDRPYLNAAAALAHAGNAPKARAMVDRYRTEMTDTSLRRLTESELHNVLAEIALAEGKARDAIAEFRRGDIGYDGFPANDCTPCLSFNLARAYDAAGKPDSAAIYFERYLATPSWYKLEPEMDPVRVPAIRERLGQLYEAMGKTDKAVEQYRAFIELWKRADPELQPRVAGTRKRLAALTPVEKPRP